MFKKGGFLEKSWGRSWESTALEAWLFIQNLPDHLNNAPMLVDSGDKVTVITPYATKDTKGNDSYVIAGVWQNQQMESDTVNLVKSVYTWDDFADRIKRYAEAGSLVVKTKNKVEQMLTTIGIQPAEVSRLLNLAKDSISQKEKTSIGNTPFPALTASN